MKFGKLLSVPVRVVNAPLRVLDRATGMDPDRGDDGMMSEPLEMLAQELERAVDGGRERGDD